MSTQEASVFGKLGSDDLVNDVTCVESLCMNCQENGETRLLLTNIPHYKDVVVSSFRCEHCFNSNTSIQSCGPAQTRGVTYEIKVKNSQDLNRQIVKGDYATIKIPEVDLEIPRESQTGTINTIEGVIQKVIDGLVQDQKVREIMDPEGFEKINEFVKKLTELKSSFGFTIILDDASGNSFVENPWAPNKDEHGTVTRYIRTLDQDRSIDITGPDNTHDAVTSNEDNTELDFHNEVVTFVNDCPACGHPSNTNMKAVNVPFFKEVIIMATICDHCGYKSDEVKSGVGIEPMGVKLICRIEQSEDLNRDVLKSETCSMDIPELNVQLEHGSLGGRFTTIEGLLTTFLEGVAKLNPFGHGDSSTGDVADKLKTFQETAQKLMNMEQPFTIILDDPAGNSFISKLKEDDERLTTVTYERTYEQNEMLGLNDMKTENYGEKETDR